jgi:hypothetical protein
MSISAIHQNYALERARNIREKISGFKPKSHDTAENTQAWVESAITGSTGTQSVEKDQNTFGLSEAEISSIEAAINAHTPISATPAYEKFLQTVLWKAKTSFPFSLDTPEYEIYNGNIRANHAGAVVIVSALGRLFGKTVRLPNKGEAISAMATHSHLAGFRDAYDGESGDVGRIGYTWLVGDSDGEGAQCAWRDQDGDSGSYWLGRRSGYSVIPCFG